MKKYIYILLALVILSAIGVWIYTDEKKTTEEPYIQPYYIALGDSLAAGMGVPPNMGYADQYFNFLHTQDQKTKYFNLGHGGDTTDNLLNIISNNKEELSKATVITLNIGINDIFERLRVLETEVSPQEIQNTYDTIANNYDLILKQIRQIAPSSKLIVLNYYNPFPEDNWFDSHIKKLNSIIRNKAEGNKLVYVDVYSAFAGTGLKYLMKENYQDDPIHPNIDGYKLMSEAIQKK